MNDPKPQPSDPQPSDPRFDATERVSPDPVASAQDGDGNSLVETLIYGLSLPERTARSASAIVGGIVNEAAAHVIPAAFRSSRSYTVFVQQALDMMIHDVGGVATETTAESTADAQLAQKAVGGLLDFAGTATLHLSPMTVLAVFNDLAYGSGHYLRLLSEQLKREGIIDGDSSIDHVSDLVDALQKTSDRAVNAMEAPPVSLTGIRETIGQLSKEVSRVDPTQLLPQAEVQRIWSEMEQAAENANVSLWDVSATMTMFTMNRISLTTRGALSTIRVAGNLFDEHIISHYGDALTEISEKGLYATLADASAPYLEAVWNNFDRRETWTEDFLTGRLFSRAWQGISGGFRGWWRGDSSSSPTPSEQSGESPKRETGGNDS